MRSQPRRAFILFVRYPLIFCCFLLLLMGVVSKRGVLDWQRMVRQNSEVQERIQKATDQKLALERQIRSFETDKSEQERVVRQILGYVKANEAVIEFE